METFCGERIFIEGNDFDDQLPKLSKKLMAYCRSFSKACENGVLVVQKIKLTKNSFSEEVCFVYHFQIMSGNFSSFWQKLVDRVVRSSFYVTIGKLRWEIAFFGQTNLILFSSFWDNERNVFGHLAKNSLQECQNCILRFYVPIGAMRVEKVHFKNLFIFLIIFGHWVRNFWFFVKWFIPGWSKLQSTFSGERCVFEENDHFGSTSVLQRKVLTVCGKILRRFVKTTSYLSLRALWGKDCFWGKF